MGGKAKIPAKVLTRAKQVVITARKPASTPATLDAARPPKKLATREKVIRALQKLHPMD